MGFGTPSAKDMFSDASGAKELANLSDDFNDAITKSMSSSVTDPSKVAAVKSGVMTFKDAAGNGGDIALASLEAMASNKSLTPEALASLNTALASQRSVTDSINKEITLTNPLSSSFAAFDLEAPAKLLTPAQHHFVTAFLVKRVSVLLTV